MEYGFSLSKLETGIVLAIFPFIYIFGTLLTPCIPARIDKRVTLMSSCVLMGVFNFLIGPSQIFGLPETLALSIIGLITSAIFLAPMVIPALPEMIEASKVDFPNQNKQTTNNYISAIFNAGLGLGCCIGPLYGAMTYEKLNFRLTEDILGVTLIVFSIIYFASAGGYSAFSQTWNHSEEEKGAIGPEERQKQMPVERNQIQHDEDDRYTVPERFK